MKNEFKFLNPPLSVFSPLKLILFSRTVGIYRNLHESVFPERASDAGLTNVESRLRNAITDVCKKKRMKVLALNGSPTDLIHCKKDRAYFSEFPFPDPDPKNAAMARWDKAKVLDIDGRKFTAVINAADHLSLFSRSNEKFSDQWVALKELTDEIAEAEPFAVSPQYGYLSANPDHVGAGIYVGFDVALFGLFITRDLDKSLKAIERLGLEIRPTFPCAEGEDTVIDAPGCRYFISTSRSSGNPEDIVARMETVMNEVIRQELNARMRLVSQSAIELTDFVQRSVAIGAHASCLSQSEALDIIHAIMFAIEMDRILQPDKIDLDGSIEKMHNLFMLEFILSDNAHLDSYKPNGNDKKVKQEMALERAEWLNPQFKEFLAPEYVTFLKEKVMLAKASARKGR